MKALLLLFFTFCASWKPIYAQNFEPLEVLGIQVAGCNADREGELIFLYTHCGFAVDSLVINLDSTYGVYSNRNDYFINQKNEVCKWKPGDLTVFEECDNLFAAGAGEYIPPRSLVIIQMTADMGTISSLKGECDLDIPIYVIANDCVRTDEAFPIHGVRKDSFGLKVFLSQDEIWRIGPFYVAYSADPSVLDYPLKLFSKYPGEWSAYTECDTHHVIDFAKHIRGFFPALKVSQLSCTQKGTIEFPIRASRYSIDGGASWSSDAIFSQVDAGIYQPGVWDDVSNCPVFWPDSVEIFSYDPPSLIAVWWSPLPDTTCQGVEAQMYVEFGIKNMPVDTNLYEYSIDSGRTFQDSWLFTGLLEGSYDLAIREKSNPVCVVHHRWQSPPLPQPDQILGLALDSVGYCYEGWVEIQATGQDVLYSTDGISYSQDSLVMIEPDRPYVVYIKESANPHCIDSLEVILHLATEFIPEIDLDGTSASFFLLAESKGPYRLLWSTGDTTSKVDNLPIGFNHLDITDGWGCTQRYAFFISETTCVFQITDSIVDATCETPTTSIYLINADTINAYTYDWNIDDFDGLPYLENVTHGRFVVEVSYGACSEQIVFMTPIGGINSVDFETEEASCKGDDGTFTINSIDGGQGPYQLNISGVPFERNYFLDGLAVGKHPFTITDLAGCTYRDTFEILGDSTALRIEPKITVTDCDNSIYQIDLTMISGGLAPYDVLLNNVSYPELVVSDVPFGVYEVEVVDQAGCSSGKLLLDLHKIPEIVLQNHDTLIAPGSPLYLSAIGDLHLASLLNWSHGQSDFSCLCTDTLLQNASEGLYLFNYSTQYGRECHRHLRFTVGYLQDQIFIPNSFTPNGDQVNDEFVLFAPNHQIINVQIYNRWGGKVFVDSGPNPTWNGSNGNTKSEEGIYIYFIELKDANGRNVQRSGTVILIR